MVEEVIARVAVAIDKSTLPEGRKKRLRRRLSRPRVADAVSDQVVLAALNDGYISLRGLPPADMDGEGPSVLTVSQTEAMLGNGDIDWENLGQFIMEVLLPFIITLIELFSGLT